VALLRIHLHITHRERQKGELLIYLGGKAMSEIVFDCY